ncbi:MAG: Dabb family protein [Oscillospiraceae bacterium]|nr:Dabb family protein [Oscillospiraceae bacterium]
MVKHIVIYNLKEDVDKESAVELIRSVLEPLVGKIPGLLYMEIRRAYNGLDYALYSEFESRDALAGYAKHPLHLEAKQHFFHLLDSRYCTDYEV